MKKANPYYEKLLKTMGKFLEEEGWKVLVAGRVRIVKLDMRKYNYTLCIDFTGGRKKIKTLKEVK